MLQSLKGNLLRIPSTGFIQGIQINPHAEAKSSDTDSDLETSIPHGLNETNEFPSKISFTQVTNTATQPSQPVLQVDRTPYHPDYPLKSVSSSASPTPFKDRHRTDMSGLENGHLRALVNNGSQQSQKDKSSFAKDGDNSTIDEPISTIEETVLPSATLSEVVMSSTKFVLPQYTAVNDQTYLKRKASEPVILSPNVTKRRKALKKSRATSEFGLQSPSVDPGDLGRRLRSEFFAGRKLSTARNNNDEKNNLEDREASESAPSISPQIVNRTLPDRQITPRTMEAPGMADDVIQKPSGPDDRVSSLGTHDSPSGPPYGAQTQEVVNKIRSEKASYQDSSISPDLTNLGQPGTGGNGYASAPLSATVQSPETQDASKELQLPICFTSSWPSVVAPAKEQNPLPGKAGKKDQVTVTMSAAPDISLPTRELRLDRNGFNHTVPVLGQEAIKPEKKAPPPARPLNVFERFKATFPEYPGNSIQFAAICKRVGLLLREDRMEHPSLWDDFIVRHRTEYPQYLSQCNDEAVDPVPYERFYRNNVSQAKYISSDGPIVTPNNLREYLPSESLELDGSQCTKNMTTYPSGQDGALPPPPNADQRKPQSTEATETSPTVSGRGLRTDLGSRATRATASNFKVIVESSRGQKSSSPTLSQPNHVSEVSKVPRPRTNKEIIDLSSDPEDRPVTKSMTSTREVSKPKQARRSIPWNSPGYDLKKGTPTAENTASSPIRPPSKIQPIPSTSAFKDARSENHTRIRSAFDEPTAIRQETPSSESMFTRSQLQNSSTPSTTASPTQKQNAKPAKALHKSSWATDEYSPYNTFVRNYQAITPGKGNSYAQGQTQENASKRAQRGKGRPIDPFQFEL